MTYTKEERERNKSILMATLKYMIEYHSIDMVFDDFSLSKQLYLKEIKLTETDIEKSRSTQIKTRLEKYISQLRYRCELKFNDYIKENTGYEIDIFEEFKTQIIPVLTKTEFDQNDVRVLEKYLIAYRLNPKEKENIALTEKLLAKHKADMEKLLSRIGVTKKSYVVIQGKKSLTMNEEEYIVYNKQINAHWLLSEEVSPNGLFKLMVQFSGAGAHSLTYVNISLSGGTGGVYTAYGSKLPIKAYWDNDNTVIIETKKEYKHSNKYNQVSSYGEVVKIEYRYV